jgi:hypothetical protein
MPLAITRSASHRREPKPLAIQRRSGDGRAAYILTHHYHRYPWPKPRASMVCWGEDKAYSGSEAYAPSSGRFLVRGGLSHGGSTEAVLVTRWFLCCCVSQKCIAWAFVLPEGSNHPKVVVDASADSMTPGVARAPSMSPLSTLPSSLKSDDVIMARLRRDDRQPVVARRLRSAGPTLHTFCLAPKCRHKESGASTSRRWPRRAPDELYSTTSPIVHLDDPRRSHETHDA